MANLPDINLGFAVVSCSAYPTDLDQTGCDGLYIESVKINWWHPKLWWILLKDSLDGK